MKNKTIVITAFFAFLLFGFALSESLLIPKFKPFGTSTTFTDSTNFVVLNKSFKTTDSLMVDKVATIKGNLYLDTTGALQIYANGLNMVFQNDKLYGSIENWIGEKGSKFYWYKSSGGSGLELMELDTITGLKVLQHIQTDAANHQIKLQQDTATDYDANDSVTCNFQAGKVTTKTLTTANGSTYSLTIANSLVLATTVCVATIDTYNPLGSSLAVLLKAQCSSGYIRVTIKNDGGGDAFDSAIAISFILNNKP